MSEPNRSPLARLILFITCLAIAGSILAGTHYYTIDLPQKNVEVAPSNFIWDNCKDCLKWCAWDHPNNPACKHMCQAALCGNP